ncbi:MAG: glycosyltransferase family 4 protein [Bacteroidota bacterium]
MTDLKRKKIVIFSSEFPPQPGGIGNHAYNLAKFLTIGNYNVCVVTDMRSDDGHQERQFDLENKFQTIRIVKSHIRTFMYAKRFFTLKARTKNADYVIATGKFPLWSVALLNISKKNLKKVAIIHGTEVNFKGILKNTIDFSLRKFDRIIAVSNYTKSLIVNLNLRVDVIPNGIDFSDWSLNKINKYQLGNSPNLITVGNVTDRKGQLNVIKHLPYLVKIFPKLHYHCIGLKTQATEFNDYARALNVENHLTFHGCLSQKDLKSALMESDIFIMLSSETKSGDTEGFGIAILEANSLGVPAIGSMGCGIEDAIKSGQSGKLVEFDNGVEFSNAIQEILSNHENYAEGARVWAKEHDWSEIIKQYRLTLECT